VYSIVLGDCNSWEDFHTFCTTALGEELLALLAPLTWDIVMIRGLMEEGQVEADVDVDVCKP